MKITEFKKGDVLDITYRSFGGDTFRSTGIVFRESSKILYVTHNLKGIKPIDITRVPVEDILSAAKIIPKEIP